MLLNIWNVPKPRGLFLLEREDSGTLRSFLALQS